METVKETQRLLYYSDLFIANFWRYLVKSLWLFFPSLLFLLLAYFLFWHLPQGKDLIVISLQNAKFSQAIFPCFILALIFWAYVTWYTRRVVARAEHFQNPNHHTIATVFRVQSPRILAFSCITVIFLALFQLDNPAYSQWQIKPFWCHMLLLLSFSWYFAIWKFWNWYLQRKNKTNKDWLKFLGARGLFDHIANGACIAAYPPPGNNRSKGRNGQLFFAEKTRPGNQSPLIHSEEDTVYHRQ